MASPRIFFDPGTLIQGSRVIRECEAYIYTEAISGHQISLRQYELECLCGKLIKRRVGDLCNLILKKGVVCCPECRVVLTGRPEKEVKPKKVWQVRNIQGVATLQPVGGVQEAPEPKEGEQPRVIPEQPPSKKGRRPHRRPEKPPTITSKLVEATRFEQGEIIGDAEVVQEELRTRGARTYRVYTLKCECGKPICQSVRCLLQALKTGSKVKCYYCRNPNLTLPDLGFELGDTVGGSVVIHDCVYGERRGKPRIGFELKCSCGNSFHRSLKTIEKSLREGSSIRCRSCTSSASVSNYYKAKHESRSALVREALADRYYRNGTIWSPFVLQLMTEDIAEESGIELNSEVPHDDFFLLYDGEPLIASSFWPRSDDSDDEV